MIAKDESGSFPCRYHYTMVLHAHITPGDEQQARSWPQFRGVVSAHQHGHDHHDHHHHYYVYQHAINSHFKVTIKAKPLPLHATKVLGGWERRYSSYSFSTSALDEGEWSASRPGRALTPGKVLPVPTVQEAGWASEPVRTQRLE
jgi:hypothetical protein